MIMRQNMPQAFFFISVLVFTIWMMTYTFGVEDGYIRVGQTVNGDFSVHTAIIRSFSIGRNFPTQFPHFPDGTMRYHFMFHFFIAALEFLGLRIDIAINTISTITLFNVALLLYVMAIIITGKLEAGMLTIVFFFFRSSFSGLRYIFQNRPFDGVAGFLELLTGAESFIGYTNGEDWGIWNINVYVNQRHFALGISLMLIGIISMIPLFKKMYDTHKGHDKTESCLKRFLFQDNNWQPEKAIRAISLGVIFGASTFFHGSAMIALMCMLAVMGLFSKHRLEYLIIAVITFALAVLQSYFFAPGAELGSPRLLVGFIADDLSFRGIVTYIIMLKGVAVPIIIIGIALKLKRFIVFFLMFITPFIFAFTISLTPDITVNHKFVMISMALLNIFAANTICVLIGSSCRKLIKFARMLLGILLVVSIVLTGIIDAFAVRNLNQHTFDVRYTSSFQEWLLTNTHPHDIFLTATWGGPEELFLAGRKAYFAWPFYAWSGGHDTEAREKIFLEMVQPYSEEKARQLMIEHGISYIVIDRLFDSQIMFSSDPIMLKSIFPTVYSCSDHSIYVLKTDYH